jgi:3-oxoacyl-[acyl-carrier protein] reductase
MFRLDGKVAVVTGGYRGLGRAMCQMLAKAGATVVAADVLPEDVGQETLRTVTEAGGKGELKRIDVTQADQVEEALRDVHKRHGRLDIVINNAGIARDNLLLRVSDDDITKTFAVNVTGAINCSRSAVRLMMRARTGRIVNLSSVVAELGNPGQTVYSASKAALIGLTKTLSREYASRGITVNAVGPGFIDTDMTKNLPEDIKKLMLERIPLGIMGQPADVAAAVVFLCSDEASYITGQVIRVNGGMYS